MRTRKEILLWAGAVLIGGLLMAGCAEVVQMGTTVGELMGSISSEVKEVIDAVHLYAQICREFLQ